MTACRCIGDKWWVGGAPPDVVLGYEDNNVTISHTMDAKTARAMAAALLARATEIDALHLRHCEEIARSADVVQVYGASNL